MLVYPSCQSKRWIESDHKSCRLLLSANQQRVFAMATHSAATAAATGRGSDSSGGGGSSSSSSSSSKWLAAHCRRHAACRRLSVGQLLLIIVVLGLVTVWAAVQLTAWVRQGDDARSWFVRSNNSTGNKAYSLRASAGGSDGDTLETAPSAIVRAMAAAAQVLGLSAHVQETSTHISASGCCCHCCCTHFCVACDNHRRMS